jgi:hypothetical protein
MEFTSRQLRAFHLVAEHQSFARAAERLFLTPSGLSVLIRELERQLGFRLFDRTTRTETLLIVPIPVQLPVEPLTRTECTLTAQRRQMASSSTAVPKQT